MPKALIALTVALLAAAPNALAQQKDVMATVHQFVDGFNKGDTKSALAACADQTSIIDEFPPHEWHGAGACAKWADDYDANAKKDGITDGMVILGKPRHVDVTGDLAYVVVPANYRFKQKGKPVAEIGSMLTIALQKGPAGWRMTAWTWTKH
ncbi:MAG TPA: nuclear transport factor 2 family protein [Gemmatimonadales bacterium]|jgi:ketosteroid isomerase-like protein